MEQIKDLNVSFERVCVPELIQILFFLPFGRAEERKSLPYCAFCGNNISVILHIYHYFDIITFFFQQGVEELMDGDIICFQRYAGVGMK